MDNRIKKIIAREGLILIGFICLGYLSFILIPWFPKSAIPIPSRPLTMVELLGKNRELLGLSAYIIYLLFRFIIWAIKTLKAE